MHILVQSSYILTCFGGGHPVIREDNATDRKTLLLEGAYLVHTTIFHISHFNTGLFMSHLPIRCDIVLDTF